MEAMINAEFIIKYTDALYGSAPADIPRYEEFRDMFSSGQIKSKTWLANELSKLDLKFSSALICGSWFGTLAFYLHTKFPACEVTCIDTDSRCVNFIKTLKHTTPESPWLHSENSDMYKTAFTQDLIINTSSEHIPDVKGWLKLIPPGKTVVLQSTDYKVPLDHVSTVNSAEELKTKTGDCFKKILFAGELKLNVYTRFMIIGQT